MTKTPSIEELIIKNFPFEEFNPGQYEAIERCIKSVRKGKKHTILSCPTGVGKSVIAMTVHNVLKDLNKHGYNSVILCTTRGLQDQYVMDFKSLVDLKGRTNYSCLHNIPEKYNSPKCIEKILSNHCSADICPYVMARRKWLGHIGSKTTNSALFTASVKIATEENPIDLCVIDEAHEIDKVIISQGSIHFDLDEYPNTEKHFKDFKSKYIDLITAFVTYFPQSGEFKIANAMKADAEDTLNSFYKSMSAAYKTILDGLEITPDSKKHLTIKFELNDLLGKLEYFTSDVYSNTEWVMNLSDTGIVSIIPIKSSGVMTDEKLFSKAGQFIHMSATIGGLETYCDNLGINHNTVEYIDINNPIPIENRKIYLKNLVKVNRSTDISTVIDSILPIIESSKGNGIIHTVSFKLAYDIVKNVPKHISKRMIVTNNRSEILTTLGKRNNAIILSPSVETGYDFKNDLARWQIIAKVPFLNLGDNYVETRLNLSSKWYTREAVLRLIQACGRIVRGLSDYGDTYIIDNNILRLITNNPEMFPSWWLDALELE